jgi:DNA polymerase III subunit epsilon
MYAIIDVETTGTSARHERITEVAVLLHDGRAVTDSFVTLVNPECSIPYFITRMTGISNEMVAGAPRFCEIARRLVEMTEGRTFVAHNASFDYHFIREEFLRLGYAFERETLCTVRLGRKLLPGLSSYSLGKICEVMRIPNHSRHRAEGDARATARLFEILVQRAGDADIRQVLQKKPLRNTISDLHQEILSGLPHETGVYYFFDKEHHLIYIGKSLDIHDRVRSHFSGAMTKRGMEMRDRVAYVSYERTGSEFIALLKESEEIKRQKPLYNKAQRRTLNAYGLYDAPDTKGYLSLQIRNNRGKEIPAASFNNMTEAREFLFRLTEEHELCQRINGLYPGDGVCFHYTIKQCKGACIGSESPADYNVRAEKALQFLEFSSPNMLIIDRGRDAGESSFVLIDHGKYIGYGFVSTEGPVTDLCAMRDHIIPASDNREVRRIINDFTRNRKVKRIIHFSAVTGEALP